MKTRIITGIIFGLVLMGALWYSELTCITLLSFVLWGGLYEFHGLLKPQNIKPLPFFTFALNGLVFNIISFYAVLKKQDPIFVWLLISLVVILSMAMIIAELIRNHEKSFENIGTTFFSIVYLAIPLGMLHAVSFDARNHYVALQILFFFFFMWGSDTGAYFSGKAFGKHKLFERLSPKKTIEGLIGGVLVNGLVGLAAWHFIGMMHPLIWVLTGMLLALTGTAGDLFESMLKRKAGVKDSGDLFPGHGGILDRFDSTFFSAPVYSMIIILATTY